MESTDDLFPRHCVIGHYSDHVDVANGGASKDANTETFFLAEYNVFTLFRLYMDII